ncbi:MAG TPA: DEAD/DEAH box helicase [Desulfobacteraceae bacterium]|jgi:SNF2 family DNA or RNA helicase|nr:DEAD/DEAH box helicase [Desulfobacteraceae bacterium]
MIGHWVIEGNCIGIECNGNRIYPDARFVYSVFKSDDDTFNYSDVIIPNIKASIPTISYSRFGSQIRCRFSSSGGKIICDVYVQRDGQNVPLKFSAGKITDHGILNGEWFFVSGDVKELQSSLSDAGISSSGQVQMSCYLRVVKANIFAEFAFIENEVDINSIKDAAEDCSVPQNLNASLYPYQEQGFKWMRYMLAESYGCLLGDEMGLGKTLQVIAVILSLVQNGKGPVLVVAPVSLLANWFNECKKFAASLKVLIHHGPDRTGSCKSFRDCDVIVTAYSTACSDISLLNMINWDLVVLDEAQNIKNPEGKRGKFIKKINREASIAITGTPFENHITDVWSLMDFIIPGMLGTVGQFSRKIPDTTEGGAMIEPIVSPIILRRLVKDVAKDLPEKVIIPQPIAMSEPEIRQYNELRQVISDTLTDGGVNIMTIQRLRMFCTHPDVASEINMSDPFATSIKYQRLTELVEEIISCGDKIIIFTSFTKMIDIFVSDLASRFLVKTMCIYGETPIPDRQNIVNQFNEYPRPAVLVLNPRAAGVGLNITGANHVIHYNLEWNPAVEDQASARAYRRGQKKTVFIYRLFYEHTVEEIINKRLNRKRDIASTTIVGTDGSEQDRQDIINALNLIPEII